MTLYEQGEILDYPQVYYVGANAVKTRPTADVNDNHGFDDERGDYVWQNHDHISFRYEILGVLGKGSFGVVAKCYDWQTKTMMALKIIRNKKRFHHQALVEVKLLEHLRDHDKDNTAAIVHMREYFYFRNHIVASVWGCLGTAIRCSSHSGSSPASCTPWQLLLSLRFLRKMKVIHCDLKPENILLKAPNKSSIKVIDFGSSCFENERVYTYIQSRFYRSPEVILGLPYDMAIDIWSFACILAELYTGYPIFPGENEVEQLACIMEINGLPPRAMVEQASRRKMFFDSSGAPRIVANSRGKKRRPASKDMASALRFGDQAFVSFLQGCLHWDKKDRFTPDQVLPKNSQPLTLHPQVPHVPPVDLRIQSI
ncbi:kinase-like domain-containing protein [Baffinella frigidus]|nr:kinase-like domain-containing protein [Cryptophyta sp. CCMP2293]